MRKRKDQRTEKDTRHDEVAKRLQEMPREELMWLDGFLAGVLKRRMIEVGGEQK